LELYVDNILKLHGASRSIVSDRGPQFTAQFWKSLHASMGIELNYSTTFHSQMDGQTERVNQVLEDLLRACVLTYRSDWKKSLSYAEFSYNNSYQASLKMAPFEALYDRVSDTIDVIRDGGANLFRPHTIVKAEENVAKVRENMKIAQSRQKSYIDSKRKDVSFEVGEHVYLKVSPL
jgi:transposase InsO family protein